MTRAAALWVGPQWLVHHHSTTCCILGMHSANMLKRVRPVTRVQLASVLNAGTCSSLALAPALDWGPQPLLATAALALGLGSATCHDTGPQLVCHCWQGGSWLQGQRRLWIVLPWMAPQFWPAWRPVLHTAAERMHLVEVVTCFSSSYLCQCTAAWLTCNNNLIDLGIQLL
jgi:hypothetical protein